MCSYVHLSRSKTTLKTATPVNCALNDSQHITLFTIYKSQNSPISLIFLQYKLAVWPLGSVDTVCPRPSVTLTFDRLTFKLVCELHLRWGTFILNLGTPGLWVLEIFVMYATNGQTDGQKHRLLLPSLQSGA